MNVIKVVIGLCLALLLSQEVEAGAEKQRLVVVSSYHREYLWSQDTNKGVCAALLDFGFLDNAAQAEKYTAKDYVESSRAVVKKLWMDTKRKSSEKEVEAATARLAAEIDAFRPEVILLGDDNAAKYLGHHYLGAKTPVVFWGINGLPLKYGLLASLERPGRNVTGVYQSGYLQECLEYLKKLAPEIKNFAILSDDSETGRAKARELEQLAAAGRLPVTLAASVVTNDLTRWQEEALRLAKSVDAFFVLNHNTLKDAQGRTVDQLEVGAWYLQNIQKPDCAHEKQFAQEGILLVVDDSGFKQGYEAVKLASLILKEGKNPGEIAVYAPHRGPVIVNRQRARQLGLNLSGKTFIEEFLDDSLALANK
jgi:ABC-type uncharacterized transport system substrate-binding protein